MYKIYIVEDDKALAQALKTAISAWDYEVCCANRLDEVTGEFEQLKPHLVLMDITLPFFNGYHWCRQI